MIPDILKRAVKLGFGVVEAKKTAKSAGIAGVGGVVYALLQPLFEGTPLADPVIGAPMVIWLTNVVRQFVTNHTPS